MAKRFAAVLLSVCMLIGMILPMSAIEAQTVKKDVAFDSATNTATITLTIPGSTPPAMNVIFVLDNSSSMEVMVGDKSRMALAIEAAKQFIGSLTDNTKVSVIEFDGSSEIRCGLVSREDALAAVQDIEIGRGTVYSGVLRNALVVAKKATAGEPVYVIFISDGEPYDTNPQDYLDAADALHKAGAKVISVGIDVSNTEALKAVQNAGYYDAKNEGSVNGLAEALSSVQNKLTRISIVDDFNDKFKFVRFVKPDTAEVINGAVSWDFTAAPTEERTCVYQIRYIGDKPGSVSVGDLTVTGPGYEADSAPAPTVNITFPPKVTGYTITITSADAQAMLEELNGQPLTDSRASLTATKTLSDGTSADANADADSVLSKLGVTWEVTGSQSAAGKSKNTVVLKQNGDVITAPASLMIGGISVGIRVNEGVLTVM
ncbi:MAG: VWA domain-containing protein [Clostridia bacterium]|nr:VWA domain-containing protein [Clostridia bacterium]